MKPSSITQSGLPKIIFDHSKQRSNVVEVERTLNYYIQAHYPLLQDCIMSRNLLPLEIPVEPHFAAIPATTAASRLLRSNVSQSSATEHIDVVAPPSNC